MDNRISGTATISVSNICELGTVGYAALDDALTAAKASKGGTIKLLANINYKKPIEIDGISITFDLNGYTLSVQSPVMTPALKVVNGGKQLLYGDGEFNVVAARLGKGIMADNNSIIEVTNVEAHFGVEAKNGSIVTVRKDVIDQGWDFYYGAFGAKASGGSVINIGGSILNYIGITTVYMDTPGAIIEGSGSISIAGNIKVSDISTGVKIEGSGSIYVRGDIEQENAAYRPCAQINGSGIIIIDGASKVSGSTNSGYISINGSKRNGVQGESPYEHYIVYRDGAASVLIRNQSAPEPIAYKLTVTAGKGGHIITGSSGSYWAGKLINLSAVPDSGYVFSGWSSSNGGTFSDAGSAITTFTMPEGDVTVTAEFIPIDTGEDGCLVTYQGAQKRYNGDSKTYDISFIATIETLEANVVGFVFSKSETKPTIDNVPSSQVKSTTTVYNSVAVADATVTAESFGGKYIFACTVTGIPEADVNIPLYVRAFSTVGTETKYTSTVTITVHSLD